MALHCERSAAIDLLALAIAYSIGLENFALIDPQQRARDQEVINTFCRRLRRAHGIKELELASCFLPWLDAFRDLCERPVTNLGS